MGYFKNSTAGDSAKNSEKYGSACNSAWSYGDGSFLRGKKALGKLKPTLIASALKLVVLAAIFLPIAVWLGYRESELVAILVMLGSATTVSSFVMARNMGHEGVLTSSIVMVTTLCSAFTLTGWLFLLKTLGLV